jgi:hypothetical protein
MELTKGRKLEMMLEMKMELMKVEKLEMKMVILMEQGLEPQMVLRWDGLLVATMDKSMGLVMAVMMD